MSNTIYEALVKAQQEMSAAKKDAKNPQFKSNYSTFASIHAAVVPKLNANGIFYNAVIDGEHVITQFIKGSEQLQCKVPLQVGRPDAQGYRSAVTYARKAGLELLSGVPTADDDDDGNAASASPPPTEQAKVEAMVERIGKISDKEGLNVAKDWLRKQTFSETNMKRLWFALLEREGQDDLSYTATAKEQDNG